MMLLQTVLKNRVLYLRLGYQCGSKLAVLLRPAGLPTCWASAVRLLPHLPPVHITFREPDIIIALARNVFNMPPSQVR